MLCPYTVAPCPVSLLSASASGTGSWADVEGQPSPLSPAASLGAPRPASGLLLRRGTQNSLKATVLMVTIGSGEGVQVEVGQGAGHLGVLSTWTQGAVSASVWWWHAVGLPAREAFLSLNVQTLGVLVRCELDCSSVLSPQEPPGVPVVTHVRPSGGAQNPGT